MDMHVHAHITQSTDPHREGHPRRAVSGGMCPALMLWTVHLAAGWDLNSASGQVCTAVHTMRGNDKLLVVGRMALLLGLERCPWVVIHQVGARGYVSACLG